LFKGYPTVKGKPLQSEDLQEIYEVTLCSFRIYFILFILVIFQQGLESNHLLNYDYLLTGYIGKRGVLFKVFNVIFISIDLILSQVQSLF